MISAGPAVDTENLVFGYDTGEGVNGGTEYSKGYRGRPGTNLFTVLGSPSATDQNVTFAVQGTGTFKRVAVGTQIGDYKVKETDVVYSYALGGTGCHYHGNDYSSVPSGTQVTLTIDYFLTSDVSIVTNYLGNFEILPGVGGTWGAVSSQTGVWHRVTLTRTATGTGTLRMLMYPGGCSSSTLSNQGTIYYRNPTVTLTPNQVPFYQGTLSNTEGLKDISRNYDIDLTNMSFDSNSLPTFDGSNDLIDIGDLGNVGTQYSIELVFKSTSVVNYRNMLDCNYATYSGVTGNVGPRLEQNSSGAMNWIWSGNTSNNNLFNYDSTVSISANTYYHSVFTMNAGSVVTYLNGSQVTTASSSNGYPTSFSDLNIGRGFNLSPRYFAGNIPVVKIHRKTLTAQEVLKNYSLYKTRFGI